MKENKKVLILSSIVCLLPFVLSIILYDDLPQQVAIHWNSAGEPDNYAHKAIAAFGLPALLFVIHLIVLFTTTNDPKKANQSKIMRLFCFWLVPALSVIIIPITLFIAMGTNISIPMVVTVMVGLILLISGNYLPKSRQNYTIGIRLPWTLDDTDNWNKTHHIAGYMWILGGLLLIVSAFLPLSPAMNIVLILSLLILLVIVPLVYSFTLYRSRK